MIAALAVGGASLFYLKQSSQQVSLKSSTPPPKPVDPCDCEIAMPTFVHRPSCDSVACHGAIAPAENSHGIRRDEFRIWFDADPHANALRALGNSVSRRMVKHLAGESPSPARYAEIYRRCFACHNTSPTKVPERLIEEPAFFDQEPAHEGVGCQACHGPAGGWEDVHYFACWKQLPLDKKRELGFRDTKTIEARATLCAGCHVGGIGKDVNHDLIAAGHPQMKFEMRGYYALMPHHWHEDQDQDQIPEFETRLWVAGQMASARAALALLESRAAEASDNARGSSAVWPEFSESDCFACHHDVLKSRWRKERGFTQAGNRVVLPWGVWHFAVLPSLAKADSHPSGRVFFQAYHKLKSTMQSGFFPLPNRVRTEAADALAALNEWGRHRQDADFATLLSSALHERGVSEELPQTWDETVQWYLAAEASLESAKSLLEKPVLKSQLEKLGTSLRLPAHAHSPQNFPQATATSEDERHLLLDILKRLPHR